MWACSAVALIDLETGVIHYPPELSQVPTDPCGTDDSLQYRSDSRLLVINPPDHIPPALRANPPAEMLPEYYEFTGTAFRRIDFPDVNAVGTYRQGEPVPALPPPQTDIPGTGWGSGTYGSTIGPDGAEPPRRRR